MWAMSNAPWQRTTQSSVARAIRSCTWQCIYRLLNKSQSINRREYGKLVHSWRKSAARNMMRTMLSWSAWDKCYGMPSGPGHHQTLRRIWNACAARPDCDDRCCGLKKPFHMKGLFLRPGRCRPPCQTGRDQPSTLICAVPSFLAGWTSTQRYWRCPAWTAVSPVSP